MIMTNWRKVAGRALCASWLGLTVAFFAMITSAGTESLELQIGPLLDLRGRAATLFVQGVIAFGLLMLVLFIPQRRSGVVMAVAWSTFWAVVLSTTLVGASSNAERAVIVAVIALFCWSAWYSWARCWASSRRVTPKPPDSSPVGSQLGD